MRSPGKNQSPSYPQGPKRWEQGAAGRVPLEDPGWFFLSFLIALGDSNGSRFT